MVFCSQHTVEVRMLMTVTAVAAALLAWLSPCSALTDDNYNIENYIRYDSITNCINIGYYKCFGNKCCGSKSFPKKVIQAMPYDLAMALAVQHCKISMVNGTLFDGFSHQTMPGNTDFGGSAEGSILPSSSKLVYMLYDEYAIVLNRNGTFSKIQLLNTPSEVASLTTPLCIPQLLISENKSEAQQCDLARKYREFTCVGDKSKKCKRFDIDNNCVCPPNRSGTLCEIKLTDDEYNPCQNGGTYYASLRGNICLCKWPYKGSYCEDKFLCYVKPCLNNGVCKSDNLTHYSCECRLPYWGKRCERMNYCLADNNPCNNGGTCIKIKDLYKCICLPGYAGLFCRADYAASYRLYIVVGIAAYLLVTTTIFCSVFSHCNKVYTGKFKLLEQGLLPEQTKLFEMTVLKEMKKTKGLNKSIGTSAKLSATDTKKSEDKIKKPEKDYYIIPELHDEGFMEFTPK
ncbi:Delta and Notch-like epidermal growth factor-related receptor [Trichinella pseudospiralis]|uniref:Delta and Notch-like epidermal growth factor-related receptor n=1 Tax=Trichinella pseudospiralis TaxID=6337 RepID=A0A0V1G422_TRIPS|nr:Delta and Notch-like epidermal growth factor-related receptor [Trichinella pseudospiralis]